MSSLIYKFSKIIFFISIVLVCVSVNAETMQIPQWYKMSAILEEPPVLGKPVSLNVDLTAIIGDLNNVSIKLLLPDGWVVDKNQQKVKKIISGKNESLKFSLVPKSELNQGSIVVEGIFDIPKNSINAEIDKLAKDKTMADSLKASVNSWESPTKRYTDVSFAIFPEESFSPLSGDMWLNYADDLITIKGFRGPSYYSDPLISVHQAQTDVEMFNKLRDLLKSDASLSEKLAENGIDLEKKRLDYLNGLYVLSVDAWKNQDYQTALDFLEQLDKELVELKKAFVDYLKIATNNIRALVFWKQGQRRLAEEAFKKAFYQNRKHKLQRYVLRNLGLLMYSSNDKSTASQMYKLAKDMKKSGYILLDKEIDLLK